MSEEMLDTSLIESDELFEHHRITAASGQKPLRVDKFLFNLIENTSRNKIQKAADAGSIQVNGIAVKSNYKVKAHDVVSVVLSHPPREIEILGEDIPLDIVYQDNELIILNKQAGLVVHPGYGNYTGTLVNALTYIIEQLPKGSTSERPGLVHRLDKNTSGIMVVALSEFSMAHLAKQFFDRSTERTYHALVWGDFKEEEGTIDVPIGRSFKDRKVMDTFPEGDYGKHAVTHYRVLERFGYVTLVECKLETGRTHQIRIHMKSIGHPIFNDPEYGGDQILKGTRFAKYQQFIQNCFGICPRHCLHAKTLGLTHPTTHERLFFDSELPQDMAQLLEKWRAYSSGRNLEG